MITELERYNFFTSRFYSAVDILCKNPPHVILISDLHGATQSVIDPTTEAIQIIGRFRGGSKYRDTYRFHPAGSGMYVSQ